MVYQKGRERVESAFAAALSNVNQVRFEDLLHPATVSLQISHLLRNDGIPFVEKTFSEFEVVPVRMANSHNPGILRFPEKDEGSRFIRGGAWWAYSFGHCDEMPKNDVPNISVCALPWGLDFAINAELRTSQEVMRQKIEGSPERFDRLVLEHGSLQLQAWLKLEHQPRFYHWILLRNSLAGTWQSHDLLSCIGSRNSTSPRCGSSGLHGSKSEERS